jgi:hypothetical protein
MEGRWANKQPRTKEWRNPEKGRAGQQKGRPIGRHESSNRRNNEEQDSGRHYGRKRRWSGVGFEKDEKKHKRRRDN